MKYTENALNILTAKSFKNIGSQKIVDCYRKEDNIITIVNKLRRFSSDNITVNPFVNLTVSKKANVTEAVVVDSIEYKLIKDIERKAKAYF